jgi:hypothetical protein
MKPKPIPEIPLEPERYELYAEPSYRFELTRRQFFKFLGGGILVIFLNDALALQESTSEKTAA